MSHAVKFERWQPCAWAPKIAEAGDPTTLPDRLEALYMEVREAPHNEGPTRLLATLAANPNLSVALIRNLCCSYHYLEEVIDALAHNPAMALLLLERPSWCRTMLSRKLLARLVPEWTTKSRW